MAENTFFSCFLQLTPLPLQFSRARQAVSRSQLFRVSICLVCDVILICIFFKIFTTERSCKLQAQLQTAHFTQHKHYFREIEHENLHTKRQKVEVSTRCVQIVSHTSTHVPELPVLYTSIHHHHLWRCIC